MHSHHTNLEMKIDNMPKFSSQKIFLIKNTDIIY